MGDPVVHFEIHGTDAEALGAFYSELFGWHAIVMPEMNNYVVIDTHAGAGINGGIATAQDGRPLVTFYIEVDDPQKYLDKIGKSGGTTVAAVDEVPGVVTFAMFGDPAGNKVGLVKGGQDGPGVSPGDGVEVSWFEILGLDAAGAEKLATFYNDVFGWNAHGGAADTGFVYYQVDPPAGRGVGGGIGGSQSGEPMTTVYARVDDLKKYLERAESLGGKTTMEPMDVGEGTEIACFTDPQGGWFGLYKR